MEGCCRVLLQWNIIEGYYRVVLWRNVIEGCYRGALYGDYKGRKGWITSSTVTYSFLFFIDFVYVCSIFRHILGAS